MNSFQNREMNSYLVLKRKIYLALVPLLFVAITTYWLFSHSLDEFTRIALPILSVFLLVDWIFMYRFLFIRAFEMASLCLFSIYHLARVYVLTNELEHNTFNLYIVWAPLFFIFIFLALHGKKGLVYSFLLCFVSIIIGIPQLNHTGYDQSLVQFYISTISYILILYYFQRFIEAYLESDLLSKLAFQDPLTHIANRRMLDTWIENEIKLAQEKHSAFSIIYFDIDHFKQVNDRYGHDAGDEVLKEFASVIQTGIRSTDYFGRWGGEEFVIIAPGQSIMEANQLAERLQMILNNHTFSVVGRVTASFGIASFNTDDDLPKAIMKRADNALYKAKMGGRNSIKICS